MNNKVLHYGLLNAAVNDFVNIRYQRYGKFMFFELNGFYQLFCRVLPSFYVLSFTNLTNVFIVLTFFFCQLLLVVIVIFLIVFIFLKSAYITLAAACCSSILHCKKQFGVVLGLYFLISIR